MRNVNAVRSLIKDPTKCGIHLSLILPGGLPHNIVPPIWHLNSLAPLKSYLHAERLFRECGTETVYMVSPFYHYAITRFVCMATSNYPFLVHFNFSSFFSLPPSLLILFLGITNDSDPVLIKEITVTHRRDIVKPLELYKVLAFYGENVVTTEGQDWSRHRCEWKQGGKEIGGLFEFSWIFLYFRLVLPSFSLYWHPFSLILQSRRQPGLYWCQSSSCSLEYCQIQSWNDSPMGPSS